MFLYIYFPEIFPIFYWNLVNFLLKSVYHTFDILDILIADVLISSEVLPLEVSFKVGYLIRLTCKFGHSNEVEE